MNCIYLLWLRQLKRYSRSRARIFGSLGQPLLLLFIVGFGVQPIYQKAGMGSYIQFLSPGVVGITLLFTSVFSGLGLVWDRQFGFLKATLVAPVPRISVMIGRTLGGATVSIIQGLIMMVACLAAGFRLANIGSLALALVFMILIALLFTAFGTAIASTVADIQGFQLLINFLVTPLSFLSGAFYPLTNLPILLDWLAKLDPLSYGVDGLRGALIGTYGFGQLTDFAVLSISTIVLLGIGSYLFSRIEL
jgi:ABC-2 type transport system permease protein